MAGEVDIANIALTNLGEAKIVSMTENSERARLCNLRFPDVRDMILRQHPWNCTIARAVLSRLAESPAWGFLYQYQLPADLLRVLSIYDLTRTYKIEGGKLLTEATDGILKYQKRIDDMTLLDASLVNVMGLRLAWELAEPLTGKTTLKQEMWQKYERNLMEARSIDASEGSAERVEFNTWLDARLGAYETSWKPIDAPSDGYPWNITNGVQS